MNFVPRLEMLEGREVPGQVWSWFMGDDPAPSSLSLNR